MERQMLLALETGTRFTMIWNIQKFCDWILAQPADRFRRPGEQFGGDYGTLTTTDAIPSLVRAFRHGDISHDVVESVLVRLTRNMSPEDGARLRAEYSEVLRLQRDINGDDDDSDI